MAGIIKQIVYHCRCKIRRRLQNGKTIDKIRKFFGSCQGEKGLCCFEPTQENRIIPVETIKVAKYFDCDEMAVQIGRIAKPGQQAQVGLTIGQLVRLQVVS
ncbi:hypothetical protein [Aurantiacibacter marinus]|uniref:hypothetical protein n=1 Tax=Aurantiacibacter marinus TaxID=874156 RepID=UPI0012E0BE0C|nr:hypothetical protein [Aurantiacibacter marinus]